MWYDTFRGIPPRGSLLETVFVLVRLYRTQSELLGTRALVQSVVGLHKDSASLDPAVQAFQAYCDNTLPFLENAADRDKEEDRKRLEEFVKFPARINLSPIYRQQAEHAKKIANLKSFRLKPKMPGTI